MAALALACMMCVTAMAAVISPEKEVVPEKGTVTTTDGTIIDTDNNTTKNYIEIKKTDVTPETIKGYSNLTVFDVKFHGISNADVILHVPGVKKGDTVIVRMYINGKWVDVEAEVVGDNQVRVKLDREGTLEVLIATKDSNNSSTSPKTGEANTLPAAYVIFAVCAVTTVTAGRKLRKKTQ